MDFIRLQLKKMFSDNPGYSNVITPLANTESALIILLVILINLIERMQNKSVNSSYINYHVS